MHFIKVRGSARAGVDFTWSPAHPNTDISTATNDITIAAGETTFTATLAVNVDGVAEDEETDRDQGRRSADGRSGADQQIRRSC